MSRRIVLVSGAPGTGKTTLALPLSEALGFPLLSKDHIKETLHDALEAPEGDLASSRRLGAASMELIWALAARCPEAILEANFHPRHPATRPRLEALAANVVEVYCRCPPEEAARRYADRAPSTHPVHVIGELAPEAIAQYEPLGIGTVIEVDTTVPTDPPEIAERVKGALRAARFGGPSG